ncbi:hypothetical protein ACOME3_008255 [Neoechinorhynchus agilis]
MQPNMPEERKISQAPLQTIITNPQQDRIFPPERTSPGLTKSAFHGFNPKLFIGQITITLSSSKTMPQRGPKGTLVQLLLSNKQNKRVIKNGYDFGDLDTDGIVILCRKSERLYNQ